MPKPIIEVQNLSKLYKLGERTTFSIKESFERWRNKSNRKETSLAAADTINTKEKEFWALKNISFSVNPGDVVGIVGRNGAGKSTLLKILSKITEPSEGRATLRGRVASLLEVGTGFHPDLTGRENVYLNGAILGMRKYEISKKFDEIVTFAEIEKFIDTPVKHYSSGMYMRLAFAVAAYLEPEILLIDEVLAVGDSAFQEKCLGKMGEVSRSGRTILFVSHNLGAIQRLCPRSILLHQGNLHAEGVSADICQKYFSLQRMDYSIQKNQRFSNDISIDVHVVDAFGNPTSVWRFGEKLILDVFITTIELLIKPSVDVAFYNGARMRLFALRSDNFISLNSIDKGSWKARFEIQNPGFLASEITFDVGVREGGGAHRKLLCNVGSLSADQSSVPHDSETDALIHVTASVSLKKMKE